MTTVKMYMGDGVYAEINPRGLVLTTNDGLGDTNTIVLEPEIWSAVLAYVASAKVDK
jgi:hypothetical protein